MGNESVEASFLSIFALISFFICLVTSKYSHKIKSGLLLDTDFNKPQSFHQQPITRSGGVAVLFSLSIFFGIYYLLFSKVLYDYIFLSSLIFNSSKIIFVFLICGFDLSNDKKSI